jgi:hypothetical protein
MRLVYKDTGVEVKVGDIVESSRGDGDRYEVTFFREPHKPASSGKVNVRNPHDHRQTGEYYVGVIGAEWIEREDRL